MIVALDESSFQMMGELQGENIRTWPRARWAGLVDKIDAGDPSVIALDVVFDTPGWDPGGDEALAKAIGQAGNVVLAAHIDAQTGNSYGSVTYSPPINLLSSAAVTSGVANFPAGVDGAIRRAGLLWPARVGRRRLDSLAG